MYLLHVILFILSFIPLSYKVTLCPSLSNLTNGHVTVSSYSEGSIASYTCGTGYTLSDTANRVCQPDGNWSGKQPSCDRKFFHFLFVNLIFLSVHSTSELYDIVTEV